MTLPRRHFLKTGALAAAGLLSAPSLLAFKQHPPVRLGIIGTGLRGRWHLFLALQREDVEVTALCDIDPEALALAREDCKKAGKKPPAEFGDGEQAYLQLLERGEVDAVIIATPWEWHVPMAKAAMRKNKYAGLEVPAALTLEECWDLVNAFEETGTPCMFLENVCYRRDVMAALNMVRKGLFGELLHLECGYQHDLREVKFNDGKQPYGGGVEFGEKGFSEARWRTPHSVARNGDLYPTHGIGPVAMMLDINRGNRFVHLTSTATKARGLHKYVVEKGGPDHPNAHVEFRCGDIITTTLRTLNGETVTITHDTNSPRPYSLGFRVQGTQGIWMDLNQSLYLEGLSKKPHQWEPAQPWFDTHDHPLWKRWAAHAEGGGHGGMDYFVMHAFIESVKRKVAPPIDVYDAAVWSAISPLSEQSIAFGSAPVPMPDFTRGKWMHRKPTFAFGDAY